MLTVVCINWNNYLRRGLEYAAKLERAMARNLTVPHQFVCLTEFELGTDLKGWWVKMLLAEPGRFSGPVLYMDLDCVVTANIDHLVELAATDTSRVWMRDDFGYPLRNPRKGIGPDTRRLLGGDGCCNSSVMLWHAGAMDCVWEAWQRGASRYMSELHGDQNAITQILGADRIGFLPDASICSYKYHVQRGEPVAPVVVFHGEPKPHQVHGGFMEQHWK